MGAPETYNDPQLVALDIRAVGAAGDAGVDTAVQGCVGNGNGNINLKLGSAGAGVSQDPALVAGQAAPSCAVGIDEVSVNADMGGWLIGK